MERRTGRSFFILKFLQHFWVPTIAALIGLSATEAAFYYFEFYHQKSVWKSINALLRNEIELTNSYQLSRSLSDMEKEEWITCVLLKEVTPNERVYFDTTYKEWCADRSHAQSGFLKSMNGASWYLQFNPRGNIWLTVSHHLMRLILASLILGLAFYYHRKNQQAEIKRQVLDLERRFLLDLATQTRHDVASPISAIKRVASVANMDDQLKTLLDKAVKRVEEIWQKRRTHPFLIFAI